MRYLKLFEGWEDDLYEEVKDFTEQSLAYLVDDGWKLEFKIWHKGYSKCINISIENDELVSWSLVKDKILPFLQLLERRYKLEDCSRNGSGRPYILYDESASSITYSLKGLISLKKPLINKISIIIEDNI
jgi:hypothetical protein